MHRFFRNLSRLLTFIKVCGDFTRKNILLLISIHYNYERPHRGYRNMGKRPIETIEAGKEVKKELTKQAA